MRALPPPCCRAVRTLYISCGPPPPRQNPCYFILGHQKIGTVFQLFENISSFIKRIPVQCHTQLTHLRCSRTFFNSALQETFNMNPLPLDTVVCLCGREDGLSGKTELPVVLYEILLPRHGWHYSCSYSRIPGALWLIFRLTSSWDSAGNGSNFRKALIVPEVRLTLKF